MAAAALRVLGSRTRITSAAAAKVSCQSMNQARAHSHLPKRKVNHAVGSPSTQTPSSSQVFGEEMDKIVEKVWQHTFQRIGEKALDWVLEYAGSAFYFALLAGSIYKTMDAQNEAKGNKSVVVNEGTIQDENTRALKPVKDLLESKDNKIKDLENDNRRQQELIEDMRKQHDQTEAALKALEKERSQKEE